MHVTYRGLLTAAVRSVVLAALAAAASASLLTAPSHAATVYCSSSLAWQPGVPPVCERFRYLRETMYLPAQDFMNRKQDFTINGCNADLAQPGGCRKPYPYNRYDWTSDGCSWTPDSWKAIFDAPCQQHDFGYRNFGKGLTMQRTETRRKWIDRRFLREMWRVCSTWSLPSRGSCNAAARTMYTAVRIFGAGNPEGWY